MAKAVAALMWGVSQLQGIEATPVERDMSAFERPLFVAAVTAPIYPGEDVREHQEACFERLRGLLAGLALSTGAPIHELTYERVWPMYLIGRQGDGGPEVTNLILIEEQLRNVRPADEQKRNEAVLLADARAGDNPGERYRHFEHAAEVAATHDGDYVSAVLNAAIATEILIKHVAWMLTWEALAHLSPDPATGARTTEVTTLKPSELIGSVLMPRLKGSWESGNPDKPVGCWRQNIAQARSAVIHQALRPSAVQARAAASAINHLERHVLDRLAANAPTYPRTNLMLLGKPGLERRSLWTAVETAVAGESQLSLLGQYSEWIGHQSLSEDY